MRTNPSYCKLKRKKAAGIRTPPQSNLPIKGNALKTSFQHLELCYECGLCNFACLSMEIASLCMFTFCKCKVQASISGIRLFVIPYNVFGCKVQVRGIGRWAHFNVKLHFCTKGAFIIYVTRGRGEIEEGRVTFFFSRRGACYFFS